MTPMLSLEAFQDSTTEVSVDAASLTSSARSEE